MKQLPIFLYLFCLINYGQNVQDIEWKGVKKMSIKFMNDFIETKVNESLDTVKLNNDVDALTRLNGISNIKYEVIKNTDKDYKVIYSVIENWSILPNLTLWTTDEAAAAYRIGLFDYNFLGRNNTVGGFYQFNGVSSF